MCEPSVAKWYVATYVRTSIIIQSYKCIATDEWVTTAVLASLTIFTTDSGSNDRKHPGSVRNGPLPPIPGSADPVSNSGHKLDRQPSLISSAKSVGSANRAEQPMLKPQSPHLGRLARAESQRESRPDLWQETPQDCRRDTQLDSHQGARHSLRQNHVHGSRPESQPDPRHNLQRGSRSLSVNVGYYIHPNLVHEDVQRVFAPYLAKNGSYLIRPSATAGKMTLCVTWVSMWFT